MKSNLNCYASGSNMYIGSYSDGSRRYSASLKVIYGESKDPNEVILDNVFKGHKPVLCKSFDEVVQHHDAMSKAGLSVAYRTVDRSSGEKNADVLRRSSSLSVSDNGGDVHSVFHHQENLINSGRLVVELIPVSEILLSKRHTECLSGRKNVLEIFGTEGDKRLSSLSKNIDDEINKETKKYGPHINRWLAKAKDAIIDSPKGSHSISIETPSEIKEGFEILKNLESNRDLVSLFKDTSMFNFSKCGLEVRLSGAKDRVVASVNEIEYPSQGNGINMREAILNTTTKHSEWINKCGNMAEMAAKQMAGFASSIPSSLVNIDKHKDGFGSRI